MKSKTYILWLLLIIVLILWCFFPIIIRNFVSAENNQNLFGNVYEALNSLFSGFAFAGLIFTIIQQNNQLKMQKEELSLQRHELELTRIELNRSASAQESTEKSIKSQAMLMEYSARLDGIKILLQTYKENSKSPQYTFQAKEQFIDKANKLEKEIEMLMDDLLKIAK
jgi:hypothetical protein